nr:MAG TPA: hypothetical protein [Caudoviricetes sp.]
MDKVFRLIIWNYRLLPPLRHRQQNTDSMCLEDLNTISN